MNPQTEMLEPVSKVELGGKERTLRVDFNALALIEERTGKSVMNLQDFKTMKSTDIRSIVWACLVHEEPALTETEVGKMLTMATLPKVLSAFTEAMTRSMRGNTPEESPAPLAAAPAQTPSES